MEALASPRRLFRNAVALGVLAGLALLVPVAFAAQPSCPQRAEVMSCCAEAPADCPSQPSPCCRLTRPAPSSPALLTASPAPQVLAPSEVPAQVSVDLAAEGVSHRLPSSPRARSSPLFITHAALLI